VLNLISQKNTFEAKPAIFAIVFHALILVAIFVNFKPQFTQQKIIKVSLFNSEISKKKLINNIQQNSLNNNSANAKSLNSVEKNNVQSEPIFDAQYLNNPAPLYPKVARDRGIEGKILLEVVVKEDGSALNVKLISSSGSSLLDESALEAVKNWQFIPAKKFGKFVQAKVIVPIEFKII
jgi:TonB family protein